MLSRVDQKVLQHAMHGLDSNLSRVFWRGLVMFCCMQPRLSLQVSMQVGQKRSKSFGSGIYTYVHELTHEPYRGEMRKKILEE